MSVFSDANKIFDKFVGGLYMETFGMKRMEDELGKVRYSGAKLIDGTLAPEVINLGYFMKLFLESINNKGLIVGADPEWGAGWIRSQGKKVLCIDYDLAQANMVRSLMAGNAVQHNIVRKRLPGSNGQFDACLIHNRLPQMCNADELEHAFKNLYPSMNKGAEVIVTFKCIPPEGWEEYIARTGDQIEFLNNNPEQVMVVDKLFKKAIDKLPERNKRKLPADILAGKRTLHHWQSPQQIADLAENYSPVEMGRFYSGRWSMGWIILKPQ